MTSMFKPGKARLNKGVVGQMLKTDPGVMDAIDKAATGVHKETGDEGTIHHYRTDRYVAGIVVRAIAQARDGVLTKAAGIVGAPIGQSK